MDLVPIEPAGRPQPRQRRLARLGGLAARLCRESLLRNSALLFLAAVEVAAGGFLFWQLVTHMFSPAEVGRASVLISTSTLVASLALLGMNYALVRYLSAWPDRTRTVNSGATLVAVAATVGAVGFAVGGRLLSPEVPIVRTPAEVSVFAALTAAAAVSMYNDNLFVALRRSGFVLSRDTLIVALRLTLPFALLGAGAFGIFMAYWTATAVALVLYFVVLARSFGLRPRPAVSAERLRVMWRYAAGTYLATTILMMPTLLMPVLIAHRLDVTNAAYYYIASLLAGALAFVPQATARSLFAEATHEPAQLRHLLVRVLRLTGTLQLPVLAVLLASGQLLLGLFGAPYRQAYPLFVLLACTLALSSVGYVGSTLLLVRGQLRALCQLSAVACSASLAGAWLLAGRGLIWVGWSLLAGEVLLSIGYLRFIAAVLRRPGDPRRPSAPAGGHPGSAARTVALVTPYFAPRIGGLENYAWHVATELSERHGWRVVVITSNHCGRGREVAEVDGLTVYRLPIAGTLSNTPVHPLWPLQVRRILRREQPDVINAHTPVPGLADVAAIVSGRVPVVLTYHASTLDKYRNPAANLVVRAYSVLQRLTFRRSDTIIAVSGYVRDCLPARLRRRTVVVPNAVAAGDLAPRRVEPVPFRLLFMANLHRSHAWKGLDQVLQAVACYRKLHREPIELVVLGDGDGRAGLQETAVRLGVAGQVCFAGTLTGPAKTQALRASSVLVCYPVTANDAFPTVVLEAWANRVPVVAAAIGALPTLIADGVDGVLVPPRRPDLLAAALHRLLTDEAAQERLAGAAAERVAAHNTWERQGARTHLILAAAIEAGARRRGQAEPGHRGIAEPGRRGVAEPGRRRRAEAGRDDPPAAGHRGVAEPGRRGVAEPGRRRRAEAGRGDPAAAGRRGPAGAAIAVAARVAQAGAGRWRRALAARCADAPGLLADRRLMVLAPHPDDETLGCGAVLARAAAAGTPVSVVVATDGRHSTLSTVYSPERIADLRTSELRAACRALGVPDRDIVQLGFEDRTLADNLPALTEQLAGLFAERRPELVLVPCRQDAHPDHRATHLAALRAAATAPVPPTLLAYPLWTWAEGPWFRTAGWHRRLPLLGWSVWQVAARRWVRVPAAEHLAAKRAALGAYASQTTNLTGEPSWSHLPAEFCALFLQPAEMFVPVSTRQAGR